MRAYVNLVSAATATPPYLVIVGDGEERAALEAQVAASGCDGIRFCGFRNQSELPRFFDLASVFVLPSRSEPWGLIVNEVMNAGRAVIITDEVGMRQPDLVTDGGRGLRLSRGRRERTHRGAASSAGHAQQLERDGSASAGANRDLEL